MARKPGRFTARTKARKRAADIIFEADQRGLTGRTASLQRLLEERKTLSAAQTPLPAYSIEIVDGVAGQLDQIDALLRRRAKVVGLDRLPGVDLAIMRVAVWEMLANPEVDQIIAIDEAVAIARSISTEKSPGRVNAVLDAIRRDLKAESEDKKEVSEPAPKQSLTDEELDELLYEY